MLEKALRLVSGACQRCLAAWGGPGPGEHGSPMLHMSACVSVSSESPG